MQSNGQNASKDLGKEPLFAEAAIMKIPIDISTYTKNRNATYLQFLLFQ